MLLTFPESLLESPSQEVELLPSKSAGSDPGRADILTCFRVFAVDGGGATSGGGGGCCGGCWDAGTHAVSGGEGGLSAVPDSTQ